MANINVTPNMEKSERTAHIVIGAILLICAVLGLGRFLLILFSLFLIVEGFLGWSFIPVAMEKIGMGDKKPPNRKD